MGIPDPHGAKQANKDIYHELYHGCTFSIIFFIIIIIIILKKIVLPALSMPKILFELKNAVYY